MQLCLTILPLPREGGAGDLRWAVGHLSGSVRVGSQKGSWDCTICHAQQSSLGAVAAVRVYSSLRLIWMMSVYSKSNEGMVARKSLAKVVAKLKSTVHADAGRSYYKH